ncbi:hypothetical protein D1007_42637 [Hordeum vulgare]|nr:hypothetical protein D1007_42637 [Hordeum vulgare]
MFPTPDSCVSHGFLPVVWLRHFQTFKDKSSALNQNTGVNRSLTEMIRKCHYPGQRMVVGKPEYKKIIEERLICMPSLIPEEDSYLAEDDCVPISQGLRNVLSRYDCNYVNSEMVNERIIMMAYILHECDTLRKRSPEICTVQLLSSRMCQASTPRAGAYGNSNSCDEDMVTEGVVFTFSCMGKKGTYRCRFQKTGIKVAQ